jgi:hypothetical protein
MFIFRFLILIKRILQYLLTLNNKVYKFINFEFINSKSVNKIMMNGKRVQNFITYQTK